MTTDNSGDSSRDHSRGKKLPDWQPCADAGVLQLRAKIFAAIRAFFQHKNVLEVDTPALTYHAVTDPNIESFSVKWGAPGIRPQDLYLTTSPEFYMKRLLAAGSGSIYQLSHVFRQQELGPQHQPEFMMLEWYRLDFGIDELMDELADLVAILCEEKLSLGETKRFTYQQVFQKYLAIDPLDCTAEELKTLAEQHGLHGAHDEKMDVYFDYLLSHVIQPQLEAGRLIFITHFPASQASLAQLSANDARVAERFELFINGIELANGFQELQDVEQQRQRFQLDQDKRKANRQSVHDFDESFLMALSAGLPDCAGVALGIDRLIQLIEAQNNLSEVLAFPFKHG